MTRGRTTNMTSYTTTILLLLAASASFQLSSAGTPEGRIVGGQDAEYLEYPFFTSWGKSCGATLIHDDILLTAAHVSRKNQFSNHLCHGKKSISNMPSYFFSLFLYTVQSCRND